jgi:ribosomal protein S12 methylthiotransferase
VDNEVVINTDTYLRLGDFVDVTITDATEFDLEGVVVNS